MNSRGERTTIKDFEARYRVQPSDVTRNIERAVIGGDWGANGYTTKDQADELGHRLTLTDDSVLLDLGAGRGWPGLYLAATTGCRVVLTDVPADALETAMARADVEGLSDRATAVICSARHLPFGAESFDAVVHTDVL